MLTLWSSLLRGFAALAALSFALPAIASKEIDHTARDLSCMDKGDHCKAQKVRWDPTWPDFLKRPTDGKCNLVIYYNDLDLRKKDVTKHKFTLDIEDERSYWVSRINGMSMLCDETLEQDEWDRDEEGTGGLFQTVDNETPVSAYVMLSDIDPVGDSAWTTYGDRTVYCGNAIGNCPIKLYTAIKSSIGDFWKKGGKIPNINYYSTNASNWYRDDFFTEDGYGSVLGWQPAEL